MMPRRFTLTGDRIRAYSRRGNYHSEPATAAALGLPGLIAQGVQAFGPAYALCLERYGADFLEHGGFDVKFVGLVLEDDTVEADVMFAADGTAQIAVMNTRGPAVAVVGTASVGADPEPGR
jgi:hypothetical protein